MRSPGLAWGEDQAKSLADALAIRRHVLLNFEAAEISQGPNEHRRLLNFVLVDANPTGVFAGAIAEAAKASLVHNFCRIDLPKLGSL